MSSTTAGKSLADLRFSAALLPSGPTYGILKPSRKPVASKCLSCALGYCLCSARRVCNHIGDGPLVAQAFAGKLIAPSESSMPGLRAAASQCVL